MSTRKRGVALATALTLLALVLTIGLALGTVSTMSLNLSRRSYLETRASLQARSAVAEFISRINVMESAQVVQLFNPQSLDLAQTFPHTELVDGCWISFSHTEMRGYCTDNSGSSQWAQAWQDRGSGRTSLPPYTLELILHSSVGGYRQDYRALLRKVWPFGIYSAGGGLVLSGAPTLSASPLPPETDPGSHFQGDCYVRVGTPAIADGSSANWNNLSDVAHVSALQLWGMLTASFEPTFYPDAPVVLGPSGKLNASVSISGGTPTTTDVRVPGCYRLIASASSSDATDWSSATGNRMQGEIHYSDSDGRRNLQPLVTSGSTWNGGISYQNPGRNPLNAFSFAESGAVRRPPGLVKMEPLPNQGTGAPPIVVPRAEPNDSVPGSHGNRYILWEGWDLTSNTYVDGSLSNRVVRPHYDSYDTGYPWAGYRITNNLEIDEYPCGLNLSNCVLTVNGDLDLCDHRGIGNITGNGATLIVNGTLALTGGKLNAGDQGMVVLARDIALNGSGDYHGLLIGLNSLTIIPNPGEKLTIHGGLVTGGQSSIEKQGGIVLRNVDLYQDPKYMKSLNPFGEFQLTCWEPL